MIVGFKLIKKADDSVYQSWGGIWGQCPGLPDALFLPDLIQVHGPEINKEYYGYVLIPWEMNDPQFYDSGTNLPKNHDTLVEYWTKNINEIAHDLLLSSDWLVIRKQESNIDIPTEWLEYRANVRNVANTIKSQMITTTDFDAFVTLVSNVNWPSKPS